MKRTLVSLLLAVGTTTAYADNWITDAGFTLFSSPVTMTQLNADGTYIYSVGSDMGRGIVRRRSLTSSGWHAVDVFAGDGRAVDTAIAVDQSAGLIYVVGYTTADVANPTTARWYVRRSKDHGNDWETIHIGSVFANGQNYPSAVRVINTHDIVVAITAYNASHDASWVLKTSYNNWGTPLDLFAPAGIPAGSHAVMSPHDMAFASNGDLLVTGSVFDTNGQRWLTRRSSPTGFVTIDESPMRSASGIVNVNGTYYVVGTDDTQTHWLTRRSMDDGVTWTDVDDQQAAPDTVCDSVRALSGTVYTVGASGDSFAARKSKDGGTTWESSDLYVMDNFNRSGQATHIFAAGGRIWSTGWTFDGFLYHQVIRVLTP